ncbi:MAG: hypothetical protein HC822_14160 [Oscillochloris sp.]|nr:hypothetical protein [Oscillochloris sp.]
MPDTSRHSFFSRLIARCWHLWGLGLCYQGNRNADRSYFLAGVSAFDRATQLWPGFAEPYFQRGVIRGRELGDYAAAIRDLSTALNIRPEWPEPYLQRGLFHRFRGRNQDAIHDLQHYIDLAPPGYWRNEAEQQLAAIAAELDEQS